MSQIDWEIALNRKKLRGACFDIKGKPQVTAFVELKQESTALRRQNAKSAATILEPVKQQAVIISYDYLLVQLARRLNGLALVLF